VREIRVGEVLLSRADVEIVTVELGPLPALPFGVRGCAVAPARGALDEQGREVREEDLEDAGIVVRRDAAVDGVAVVVRGVEVRGLVTAEVAVLVEDRVEAPRADGAVPP